MNREYGYTAKHLFDTRIAAQLLNEPGVGLAALLEKYLGIRLDKRFQRADWSARPLSPEMLEYAASDTRYLPQLRDLLRQLLEERGRLGWAQEEFALLEDIRPTPPDQAEPGWLRVKGAKALRGRELAMLQGAVGVAGRRGAASGSGDVPNPQQRADAGDGEEPAHGADRPQSDSGRELGPGGAARSRSSCRGAARS